ncbi:DUF6464 family protein [Leptolyngbya sp. PCC 6406]|uniref:DUF6464 family protein n=1 Tax=Leptolyngbya sp. PCC 6406 TaxID=1173264 RepID=UPI0003200C72|nr:DUF6464 family protein [Leptolyngbya sp. PCC 6406]
MWIVVLIFGLSLLPALVAAWISMRAQKQLSEDFSRARAVASERGLRALLKRDRDLNYVEGIGYIIGDFTCQMNARSPHLRCAFNPCGPCEGCQFYEAPVFREVVKRVPETTTACPLPPLPKSCPLPPFPIPAAALTEQLV